MVFNAGLAFPDEDRIVAAGPGGTPEVSDGPFAESRPIGSPPPVDG
jgi:hypothetical protein